MGVYFQSPEGQKTNSGSDLVDLWEAEERKEERAA
jgi:hypothetical protein